MTTATPKQTIMKNLILTLFTLICVTTAMAGSRDDYRRFTDTIRAEVYAMELPAFGVKEIPDRYKNESAVIKAVYEEVNARKKTGFGRMSGTLGFSRKAQVRGSHLTRMLVHINDKAALDQYSELDFDTDKKTRGWDGYEKNRHTMGVRVIKPDGSVIDIDTSEFVDVEEGKKGEKKSRKLAIPGLETGDDLDIFYYTESKLQNVHPDPITFTLRDDAPIMDYRIHCVVDDNLTTQYRTLGGAPDFTVTRDHDKNYVLDLAMTDIPKEPRLWYDPDQQSPKVKLYIFNRRNSDDFTPKSARKDGLQPNPDPFLIIEDRFDAWDWWILEWPNPETVNKNIRDGKKIGKRIKELVKNGTLTPQQAADYVYNLICYIYVAKRFSINYSGFDRVLHAHLRAYDIPTTTGITTTDRREPLPALANLDNAHALERVDGTSPRFYIPPFNGIMAPTETPPAVQGRQAIMWRDAKKRKKTPYTTADFTTLPLGSADDNSNLTTLSATISGTDLEISRTESYLGATKPSGFRVLSEQDINEGYLAYLNRHDITVEINENKKEAADRLERYADGLNEQKEDFKKEIKSYHGTDAATLTSGRVTSIGIDPDAPALTYTVDYTIDNLVKRAGKNLILSVGRLMSSQIEPLPSDRARTDTVWIATPRQYTTRITLSIPDGYTPNPRSLSALATSVSNHTGSFTVTATLPKPGTVAIDITKRYTEPRLAPGSWPDLLKVLDAAALWQSSTLILDKK